MTLIETFANNWGHFVWLLIVLVTYQHAHAEGFRGGKIQEQRRKQEPKHAGLF